MGLIFQGLAQVQSRVLASQNEQERKMHGDTCRAAFVLGAGVCGGTQGCWFAGRSRQCL